MMMDQQMQRSTNISEDGQPFKFFGKIIPANEVESFKQIREILEQGRKKRRLALLQESASNHSNKKQISSFKKLSPRGFSPFYKMRDKPRYLRSPHSTSRRLDTALSGGTNSYHKEDIRTQKMANKLPSQECCRALQFESGDEVDCSDDHTAPLAMMDITNMISGSSILPTSQQRHQLKENRLPVIKKSIVCLPNTSSGLRSVTRRKSLIKTAVEDGHSQSSLAKTRLLKPTSALNQSNSHQALNANSSTQSELEGEKSHCPEKDSTKKVTFAKGPKPARRSLKRRSASALCVRTPTLKNAKVYSRVQSTSKIPRHGVTQQVGGKPVLKRCQKPVLNSTAQNVNIPKIIVTPVHHIEMQHDLNIPGILGTPADNTDIQHQDAEKSFFNKVQTCDAGVNTSISFMRGSCFDEQFTTQLENLSKELDEISMKAKLLSEQTRTRRQQMKDSGIMKSFLISVSPLGRLKHLLQNRDNSAEDKDSSTSMILNNSAVNENVLGNEALVHSEVTCIDESINAGASLDPDSILEECSNLNTTSNLNASHSYWSHLKHDNRFLQTPASIPAHRLFQHMPLQPEDEGSFSVPKVEKSFSVPKVEKSFSVPKVEKSFSVPKVEKSFSVPKVEKSFSVPKVEKSFSVPKGEETFRDVNAENSKSPFAQLVGDCERPSLAPMTPHSRQQVSQLKLSLKKQLELLYD